MASLRKQEQEIAMWGTAAAAFDNAHLMRSTTREPNARRLAVLCLALAVC